MLSLSFTENDNSSYASRTIAGFFSRSLINSNIIIRERKKRGRERERVEMMIEGWKKKVVSRIYSYIYIYILLI